MASEQNHVEEQVQQEQLALTLVEFLESTPPNQLLPVVDLATYEVEIGYGSASRIQTPDLQLHCASDACNGLRFYRCTNDGKRPSLQTGYRFFYLTYRCSNCQKRDTEKTFALAAKIDVNTQPAGQCYKFGELPTFGPPTPARLIKLIGPDRDEFLKGRRCENQGLGVGAFIYYRRVVENQKDRILSEIIKVAEKLGAQPSAIEELNAAKAETQFAKALSMVKTAIPQTLLINGHNPIALLHSALSDGVHKRSDEECLELAASVRIVLAELSERLAQALKDEAELTKALSTLMHQKK